LAGLAIGLDFKIIFQPCFVMKILHLDIPYTYLDVEAFLFSKCVK